ESGAEPEIGEDGDADDRELPGRSRNACRDGVSQPNAERRQRLSSEPDLLGALGPTTLEHRGRDLVTLDRFDSPDGLLGRPAWPPQSEVLLEVSAHQVLHVFVVTEQRDRRFLERRTEVRLAGSEVE